MASFLTSPASSFVAGTKAKAAEVNSKFTAVYGALTDGTVDLRHAGGILSRIGTGNVDVTANASYINAYHTIDTTSTYKLKDSTSRMVIFDSLTINTGGVLELTSGAEVLVL